MAILKTSANKSLSFEFHSLTELRDAAERLNIDLNFSSDYSLLFQPYQMRGGISPNRFCVQPLEGGDAADDGSPGELTLRRYRRFAEGGFGLIWIEAVAVEPSARSNPRQLCLTRANAAAFSAFAESIRACARERWQHEICLILQLSHAGRYCAPDGLSVPLLVEPEVNSRSENMRCARDEVVSDIELERLQQSFIERAHLALELGFDGVDIKACYNDLIFELLQADNRPGRFGGSLINRSRFLCEVVGGIKEHHPNALLASRLSLPHETTDETIELASRVRAAGVALLNVTTPDASGRQGESGNSALRELNQSVLTLQDIRNAVPELAIVAGGVSWLRHYLPAAGAAILQSGAADLIGIGRAALAYPDLVADLVNDGALHAERCCLGCDACVQLLKDNGVAGCAVTDGAIYAAEYRERRFSAVDNLREEAQRCRQCAPAPCRSGCPADIDVPAFLKAFVEDDVAGAYEILRSKNVLSAMCALLCPVNTLCESRCVAGILDGRPIPIHAIQFLVCQQAAASALTGVRLPEATSGKMIAVIGAGPAGVSCAAELLERGHRVVIYERSSRLGGTPELLINQARFSGAAAEVEALLKPALHRGRVLIKCGFELGDNLSLHEVRHAYDAVFLATGVWGEKTLGAVPGVVSGVEFLARVRSGKLRTVPRRVVLLAGGDSAMDCARGVLDLGASELLIVYAGALAELHWHLPDSWFRTSGVHFLTMTQPLGYATDSSGSLCALKICNKLNAQSENSDVAMNLLQTTLVIEAMGLEIENTVKRALAELEFSDHGLLCRSAPDSYNCGLPGVFAGGALINGGDSVVRCITEGRRAAVEIDDYLRKQSGLL